LRKRPRTNDWTRKNNKGKIKRGDNVIKVLSPLSKTKCH